MFNFKQYSIKTSCLLRVKMKMGSTRRLWEFIIVIFMIILIPCSYAFVAEDGAYNFSTSDLNVFSELTRVVPMVLDSRVGNQSCSEAQMDPENYACKENTFCQESDEFGNGYLCRCSDGFQGNPYLSNGCQDINECKISSPCDQNAECFNLPGSFNCTYYGHGIEGDGIKDENGGSNSVHKRQGFPYLYIGLGVSLCFIVLVLSLAWRYWWLWQRLKLTKQKDNFFQQNGGISLQRLNLPVAFQIFTAKEIKKATNNYHENRILGQGRQDHATYKGMLPDGQIVAIKQIAIGDRSQVEQFINKVIIVPSQINHKNVVKFLGCCLETRVPLLVHEFVSKGTLFNHLHHGNVAPASVLSWENRLRIAAETAEAISYVHSAASPSIIIHGDVVKSTNILLDENYHAKVSAFGGASRLLNKEAHRPIFWQGTTDQGYYDCEFIQTGGLTRKSDVYSFGVVLIELLTSLKAFCSQRPKPHMFLAVYFVSVMKEDRLLDIVDRRVVNEENIKQVKEVAALASKCVRLKGKERPTMKEVATKLEGLRGNGERLNLIS